MTTILPNRTRPPLLRLSMHLKSDRFGDARFFILVDENTYNNCMADALCAIPVLQESEFIEVPCGEECKSIEIATQIWQTLMESGADRNSVIICLGGGCICDLGGFVASTYMRGIRHINIPTTLTAMVDAAIGGKTAVNLDGIKNAIGTFHQPQTICIEPAFLKTLPSQLITDGCAELIKTLLVAGPEELDILHVLSLTPSELATPEYISMVAAAKLAVVKQDPLDQSVRHILNFGHTFGHAFESFSHTTSQTPLSHGHCVALGMACAIQLSCEKAHLDSNIAKAYTAWLKQNYTLPHYSLNDSEQLLGYMRHDKKNICGDINCVLLMAPQNAIIDYSVPEEEIRDTILGINDL